MVQSSKNRFFLTVTGKLILYKAMLYAIKMYRGFKIMSPEVDRVGGHKLPKKRLSKSTTNLNSTSLISHNSKSSENNNSPKKVRRSSKNRINKSKAKVANDQVI
jgi:hypothetical protein